MDLNTSETYRSWPHAPAHLFAPDATYMVTAGTCGKARFFDTPQKRDLLKTTLFQEAARRGWQLHAWALLDNHYHIVAKAPELGTLGDLMRALHSRTAIELNRMDDRPGRKVWYQYWDSCITHERSYLARLNYVHQNPVKHGAVHDAANYPWCSMAWFQEMASPGFRDTVLSFKTDRISVLDDF